MDGQQRVEKPRPDTSQLSGQRGVQGELSGRFVESPQVERRGLVSGFRHPFSSAKNIFARQVYTPQELELRADRQLLENSRTPPEERSAILSEIRAKLE